MTKNKPAYEAAIAELESILAKLEDTNEVNFDELNANIKRASELLKYCKEYLHDTDKELEKLLSQLSE